MSPGQGTGAPLVSVGDHDALGTPLREDLHEIWLDRDVSWLQFNERVLAEALDERIPLLERVKFLAVVTSNTDGFFMKRLSVLRESSSHQSRLLIHKLRERIIATSERQARCWNEQILPALENNGIHIRDWDELTLDQQAEASEYFDSQVYPALTPLVMNSSEAFPFVSNLSTSLVFTVSDASIDEPLLARIRVPAELKSWVPLKVDAEQSRPAYIALHEIIRANLGKIYLGVTIGWPALVRITRDAEVDADDSDDNTIDEVRRQVRQRRFEPVVRLEFTEHVDPRIRALMTGHFGLSPDDIYHAPDRLKCSTLFELSGLDFPELKDPTWQPVKPPALQKYLDLFAAIRAGDVLVHHPYESFDESAEAFIVQASEDPNVVAIKMTVYRVGDDTPFVRSLIRAAESGKQVACVIELRARFDEERNLHWANALVKAGAHVSFGIKGLKIHGKTAVVVRKENDELRTYVHIATGNYHTKTAKLYTDVGLFTCDGAIAREVVGFFHHLTGHSKPPVFSTLLVAPFVMRKRFLELISREAEHARQGRPARIIAKMNQLEDPKIIEALYDASAAGVSIDLIIRGFCCLRPGVPGRNENISVRSIIGRFLEHSRIYYFANGTRGLWDGEFYIGSADWMHRNLSKRIEVATPVTAPEPRRRLAEILELYLKDRRQSWLLGKDGEYHRVLEAHEDDAQDSGIHQRLMNLASNHSSHDNRPG
ncbi:MAG: polyphosphate kinase 1 [Bryobacteraceae bacterium]